MLLYRKLTSQEENISFVKQYKLYVCHRQYETTLL